jgi:hypothetical protein
VQAQQRITPCACQVAGAELAPDAGGPGFGWGGRRRSGVPRLDRGRAARHPSGNPLPSQGGLAKSAESGDDRSTRHDTSRHRRTVGAAFRAAFGVSGLGHSSSANRPPYWRVCQPVTVRCAGSRRAGCPRPRTTRPPRPTGRLAAAAPCHRRVNSQQIGRLKNRHLGARTARLVPAERGRSRRRP